MNLILIMMEKVSVKCWEGGREEGREGGSVGGRAGGRDGITFFVH